LLAIVI